MASRNYHKRRTKERKARQAAQQQERFVKIERARQRMVRESLNHGLLIEALAHAPRMFVRNGKPVPFDYL